MKVKCKACGKRMDRAEWERHYLLCPAIVQPKNGESFADYQKRNKERNHGR